MLITMDSGIGFFTKNTVCSAALKSRQATELPYCDMYVWCEAAFQIFSSRRGGIIAHVIKEDMLTRGTGQANKNMF